jgi:hypothetical protein
MTVYEMRLIYPRYAAMERAMEARKTQETIELGVQDRIIERAGRELSTQPALTPVTHERSKTDG